MSDLSLSTIRRYLEEMGFPDLPDEQVISLRRDVIARLEGQRSRQDNDKFVRDFKEGNVEELLAGGDDARQGDVMEDADGPVPSRGDEIQRIRAQLESSQSSDEEAPVFRRPSRQARRPVRVSKDDLLRQETNYDEIEQQDRHRQEIYSKVQRPTKPTATSYAQSLRITGHTKINGLLGPNRYTIEEKKKRKSDPVSNFAKYQQRWLLQGPPEERGQRSFVNRVRETNTYGGVSARYFD